MTEIAVAGSKEAEKGYNPPDPNSATQQRKYRRDKAIRIAALPPDVQKLRLQIIQLKSREASHAARVRSNRREIGRIGRCSAEDKAETQSLAFAMGGHQRDRERSRVHIRAIHLASGFIRGVPYERIETKSYTYPHWGLVRDTIKDVCGDDSIVLQKFAQWQDAAKTRKLAERRRLKPMAMLIPAPAKITEADQDPMEPPTAA